MKCGATFGGTKFRRQAGRQVDRQTDRHRQTDRQTVLVAAVNKGKAYSAASIV